MSRCTTALIASLSVLVLGSPLIAGCSNSDGRIYFRNAGVKYKEGDFQGAIADYTKAIEINPQEVTAYRSRGIKREMIGDLIGACEDWKKASSLGDKDAVGWVSNQCL